MSDRGFAVRTKTGAQLVSLMSLAQKKGYGVRTWGNTLEITGEDKRFGEANEDGAYPRIKAEEFVEVMDNIEDDEKLLEDV